MPSRRGVFANSLAAGTFRRSHIFLIAALAVVALVACAGTADAAKAKPKKSNAYSSIVIDAATGRVLHEDNADAQKYPASLTKMMTLYMIFEALDAGKIKLSTRWTVSRHAEAQSPTKLGLEAGDQVSVRDVILGLITKSANDAAAVAAESLGGTEDRFGELMTQRARRLGMASTTFRNASGLPDPGQVTTARDMARLSRALIRDFPHHYGYFSTPEFTYAGRRHPNHNRLMNWYEGADGIKTGFIRASGFNLAASAVRDNKRLVGVVLGGQSPGARDKYMGQLLDSSFGRATDYPDIRHASTSGSQKSGKVAIIAEATPRATKNEKARGKRTSPVVAAQEEIAPVQTVSATAVASTGAGDDSQWAVQVGAFHRIDAARRAAESAIRLASDTAGSAEVEISTLDRKKKNDIHRARLTGLSETQARSTCRVLERKHRDCLLLSPVDLRSSVRVATN